jgi:hypothetical protein
MCAHQSAGTILDGGDFGGAKTSALLVAVSTFAFIARAARLALLVDKPGDGVEIETVVLTRAFARRWRWRRRWLFFRLRGLGFSGRGRFLFRRFLRQRAHV